MQNVEKVKVLDAGGDSMTLLKFTGVKQFLNTTLEDTSFAGIRNLALRDDDVILCAYPRSGTHWTWEQIRMLISGKPVIEAADKDTYMFIRNSHGELDRQPSPRVFNSHLWFSQLPAEVTTKRTKIVLIYRHPKDVCVSFYLFHRSIPFYEYEGKFPNWIQAFLDGKVEWGSYAEYLREWEQMMEQHPDHPVLVLSYESLKENAVEQLHKLSRFLGEDHDVNFLRAVSDACAIEKMRVHKDSDFWMKNGVQQCENLMYRQGKSGDWKNWFTVAQSEQFDRQWAKAMAKSKLFKFC